jgi:FkbM family methyltransferase
MNTKSALESAIDYVNAGMFAEAEAVYLNILQSEPNNKIVAHLWKEVAGAIDASINGSKAEKRLLQSFREQVSHYPSVPEYNLNWCLKDLSPISDFLESNPLNVVDVGARDGFLGEIEDLKAFVNFTGFDADPKECQRLNNSPPKGFKSFNISPFFIGAQNGQLTFNIYKSPGDSSVYPPSEAFRVKFNNGLSIQNSFAVRSIRLEEAVKISNVPQIDFLKLDTQGSELDILKGSESIARDTLLIEAEVEITEMYKGQPLIGEFISHMRDLQFEVLYINRVFANRQDYHGPARGQVIFCDILFSKQEEIAIKSHPLTLAKHLILLCAYGHLDVASHIWSGSSQARELLPKLSAYFCVAPPAERCLEEMSRDKRLCWQLHQRKTNQLRYDSDRSWPTR